MTILLNVLVLWKTEKENHSLIFSNVSNVTVAQEVERRFQGPKGCRFKSQSVAVSLVKTLNCGAGSALHGSATRWCMSE